MPTQAIMDAVAKTKANIGRFGDLFPHVSEREEYAMNPNTEWTAGFWPGILWLCYEYTRDGVFLDAARRAVDSMRRRLERNAALDHHDIGFLYSLSSKAQWILERDPSARELTLQAADALMKRWREKLGVLQAWGPENDPVNGGRIIIDCMMNLPLLYWAAGETGKAEYRRAAVQHAGKSRRFLVRGDDSSYHTFFFNQETADSIGGGTAQGYRDGSAWTRGQAWGIYGFALSYRYTRDPLDLETSRRLAQFFVEHLPEDHVAYWDFDVPVDTGTKRDSSASAIAAAGMLELIEHLDSSHPQRNFFRDAVKRSMDSLMKNYSTMDEPGAQGFIKHGSYSVRGNAAPDGFMIWGDYFYLEALMRMEKQIPGYWYDSESGRRRHD